jgi:pantothenate kinase type III
MARLGAGRLIVVDYGTATISTWSMATGASLGGIFATGIQSVA